MHKYIKQLKYESEDCLKIPISALYKANSIFKGSSGSLTWDNSDCQVNYLMNVDYSLNLKYCIHEKLMSYEIPLTTSRCNFGGKRYWFRCPIFTNGNYCGKRIGVLYLAPNSLYFACRHCQSLTYRCRKLSGSLKAIGRSLTLGEIKVIGDRAKKKYYKGKLTKPSLRHLKELYRFEKAHNVWYEKFMKNIAKLKKVNLR